MHETQRLDTKRDRVNYFPFGFIKTGRAAFDMFILFFRVSLKGSDEAVY